MLERGKHYNLRKDADGWNVWSFGRFVGRIYRNHRGSGYLVVGSKNVVFTSKEKAVAYLLGYTG